MSALAQHPKVAYLGLTLEYYRELNPARISVYRNIMLKFQQKLTERFEIVSSHLCCTRSEVSAFLDQSYAENADVIVVSALSYTDSFSSSELLANAKLPVVFWNTQYLEEVTEKFCDNDLSDNHTVQGVHDVAAVLHRLGHWLLFPKALYIEETPSNETIFRSISTISFSASSSSSFACTASCFSSASRSS